MTVFGPLIISFLVALLATPLLRWFSHRHDLLDHPNERSSHVHPTPRNGGIAIILGLVATLLVFGGWRDFRMIGVLVWAATIAGLGFVDDLKSLPARLKLAVQVGAAVATLIVADVSLTYVELPLAGVISLPLVVGTGLTLFWIVGVTNAYNFMDGVNGIATIEAIVCGGAYAYVFFRQGDGAGSVLAMALVGGSMGFLFFNASGSIFMGDVGSGTIGFLFAVLALRLTYWDVPLLAAILPLLPFLLDTTVTLLSRARRGERLFSPHRSHYYQRLTDLGLSHMTVSLLYGVMAALCSGVLIVWGRLPDGGQLTAVGVLLAIHFAGGVLIDVRHRRLSLEE